MPRLAVLLPTLPFLLAAFGCGGRIDDAGDGGGGDSGSPNAECPVSSAVHEGAACESAALRSCQSDTPTAGCNGSIGGFVSCDCIGHVWTCAAPGAPTCPDASPDEHVPESGIPLETGGPPPPCPPRDSLLVNTLCSGQGQVCAGDPTPCQGAVFYDALQCEWDSTTGAWRWHSIATTVCREDAGLAAESGLPDAARADAGFSQEASVTGDAAGCTLLGSWHTHSAPWNGLSTDATITFNADGTLTGQPTFTGTYSYTGSTLAILTTQGPDMNCGGADTWTVTYSIDCMTAPLVPIGSGCTGARRYLDWNVTLTRN